MKILMKSGVVVLVLMAALLATSCNPATKNGNGEGQDSTKVDSILDTLRYESERHFKNVRRLTQGGNNAEAYFSFDGTMLSFQSDFAEWDAKCDQIFMMPTSGTVGAVPQRISTGKGRTTCAYFMPGNKEILYASTHTVDDTCPPTPERKVDGKYVWPVYDTYDIFVADLKGNIGRQLTNTKGYDAEATVSPDGSKIVFTSTRSGDLELWTMNIDGSNPTQITNALGYDGGAFFSPDSKKLVWRASRPTTPEDQKSYKDLLKKGLVEPGALEVFVANADGSDVKQVTNIGKANWAPSWHPSGEKIIFASNHKGEKGRQFNLFLVNIDGTGLEQISFDGTFDAFPVFSPDGKHVAFSSNRFNGGGHDTNVFLAEWVE